MARSKELTAAISSGQTGELLYVLEKDKRRQSIVIVILVAFIIVLSAMYVLRPNPTFMVDEEGRLLGHINFLDNSVRSHGDVAKSIKSFFKSYHSMGYSSILNDLEASTAVLNREAARTRLEKFKKMEIVALINTNKYVSRVVFDEATILSADRGANLWRMKVVGKNLLQNSRGVEEIPFANIATFSLEPKSKNNNWGITNVVVEQVK